MSSKNKILNHDNAELNLKKIAGENVFIKSDSAVNRKQRRAMAHVIRSKK